MCVYDVCYNFAILHTDIDTSTAHNIVALMVVSSFITMVTGHDLIVTEDTITSLSDNFVEEVSHYHVTQFPAMCEHMPANCEPFLLPYVQNIVVLIPSMDPLKHIKLTNDSINSLNELRLTNCFRYLPTGSSNLTNDLYVLCLKNQTHETTIVTYLIDYEEFTPTWYQYGNKYGTHIDLDSPLTVISNNFSGPVVLYIATIGGNARLYINPLRAGGDAVSVMSLPNTCTGPYELKHLYQLHALLKCSNGFVYIYDAFIGEFTKLPGVQDVTMISRCTNSSSSFVMITHQGNILLNKSASEPLRAIPFFIITVNSRWLNAILSFACHWNGLSTQLYFTTSQDDGQLYFLSVSLEHVAESTLTEAHQMLKFSTTHSPSYTPQPSIVGSAWITELTDEGNNMQERVFINIITGASSRRPSNGLAYLLSYADKPFHSHGADDTEVKDTETESDVKDTNGLPQSILVTCSVIIVIVASATFALFILIYKYRHRSIGRHGSRVQIELETYSRVSGDTETSFINDETQMTTNEDINQAATDFHSQAGVTTGSHSQAGVTTDSYSQAGITTGSHSQAGVTTDSYSQAGITTGSHSQAGVTTGSHSQAGVTTGSHSQTAIDSSSNGIGNTTNLQADNIPPEFVPATEETSESGQLSNTRGQQVTGYSRPEVPRNEPRGNDSDDETLASNDH